MSRYSNEIQSPKWGLIRTTSVLHWASCESLTPEVILFEGAGRAGRHRHGGNGDLMVDTRIHSSHGVGVVVGSDGGRSTNGKDSKDEGASGKFHDCIPLKLQKNCVD